MKLKDVVAVVTGGGSGLGAATVLALAREGARVVVLDVDADKAAAVAAGVDGLALACDITDAAAVEAAFGRIESEFGDARVLMNVAGIGGARRIVGRDGQPAPLSDFERVVRVNLIGAYNVSRVAAARMVPLAPLEDGERGFILMTASVAAYDGQIGQEAYAASKGGIVSMTLPMARDLAAYGVRVVTIAPGLFGTPLMQTLPQDVQDSLAASIPFPKRLGAPEEFAELAIHATKNVHLNGETIRLDGALRMAPH